MDNQHKRITGYRDLTADEIALMNKIKAAGTQIQQLLGELQLHIVGQDAAARTTGDGIESARIESAQPGRWLNIARTDFQTGLMAAVRAVAQPGGF